MTAGRILKLAGQNYINGLPEHYRTGAIEILNSINSAADRFNEELAATEVDRTLSPEGRGAKKLRVAASALATLAAVEATIRTLTERAALLEASLLAKATPTPPTDPAKRIAYEAQLQEIRNQLRQLSPAERLSAYLSATDSMVLAAIEDAPVGVLSAPRPDGSRRMEPFVDPEQVTAARLGRAKHIDPATATTFREVGSLREIYSHAVNSVRAEIAAEMPGAGSMPEPVAR